MRKWFLKVSQMNIAKCFALLLVVLALTSVNGVDVDAAETAGSGYIYIDTFTYNGVEVPYYYIFGFDLTLGSMPYKTSFLNGPVYGFKYLVNGKARFVFVSENSNTWFWDVQKAGYSDASHGFQYDSVRQIYKLNVIPASASASLPSSGTLDASVENAFWDYFVSDDFIEYREPVDFNNYNKCDWLWIEDFRAELQDSTIYMTWGDLAGYMLTDQNTYKNRYIEFWGFFVNDNGTADLEDDTYFTPEYIQTDYSDYEASISFADWEVPDGYRLMNLYAIPYWFYMDIPDGKISKGKMSMITFDEDGSSGNPLLKNPDDIYNPLNPDYSNWNALTNFTGNYFDNMQQTFDNTFQNYDASGMDDNTDKLGGGLRRYQDEQDAIIDGVSANIEQFNPGDYLNFSEQIVYAMGMASGWINQFLDVSADFTTVFIVGCIMVVIFVVIGIWRFQ